MIVNTDPLNGRPTRNAIPCRVTQPGGVPNYTLVDARHIQGSVAGYASILGGLVEILAPEEYDRLVTDRRWEDQIRFSASSATNDELAHFYPPRMKP